MFIIPIRFPILMFGGEGAGHGVGGGPGGLEVEAAGDAVDVEDLATEVEAGVGAALEGLGVDGGEGYAATGDELVAVGGSAAGLEGVVGERVEQAVLLFLVERDPGGAGALGAEALLDEVLPESLLQAVGSLGGYLSLGVEGDEAADELARVSLGCAEPVDGQCVAIAALAEQACAVA